MTLTVLSPAGERVQLNPQPLAQGGEARVHEVPAFPRAVVKLYHPEVLVSPVPPQGDPGFRAVLARRAMAAGMSPTPDEIVVTHGCTEDRKSVV